MQCASDDNQDWKAAVNESMTLDKHQLRTFDTLKHFSNV